jgi:preprotein translocase subunit SecE
MAVHKIKAKDDSPSKKTEKSKAPVKKDQKPVKKTDDKAVKAVKKAEQKPAKKGFILFRPFIAFARYVRDSWREIRQVRWPNRKLTWKMTGAVIVYVIIFGTVIMLLDMLFSTLFNLLLGV